MVRLEETQEVRLQWDWQEAIFPREYVRKLQYEEGTKRNNEIECSKVILAVDLAYIKEHNIVSPISKKEITIFDRLQEKDVWNIVLITEKEKYTLNLPSYRKESYCGEKELLVSEDAQNLCERHQVEKAIYTVVWEEIEEKEFYMSQGEWSIFLQKGNLTDISTITHPLGIELVDRVLLKNKEENLDMLYRIHEADTRRKEIYNIKKGYTLSKEYYPLHGIDIFILNAKNHAHHWNFNFILVPNLAQEEQNLYKVIEEGIPNEDTKNYFSRTIIVYDEKEKLKEEMLGYLNENLLFVTYQELNKIWYEVHKEWNLL